jgi:hypothetical protein
MRYDGDLLAQVRDMGRAVARDGALIIERAGVVALGQSADTRMDCAVPTALAGDALEEVSRRWNAAVRYAAALRAVAEHGAELSGDYLAVVAQIALDSGGEPAPDCGFSARELATVLAALRLWQREVGRRAFLAHDPELYAVATDAGRFRELAHAEIVELADRLNVGRIIRHA